METYFKFKLTMEILPIIIFVTLCVLGVVTSVKEHFVKKFFFIAIYDLSNYNRSWYKNITIGDET